MTIAVTGGSGVVGGALLRHLVESGDRPRAMSRSVTSDHVLEALGAEPHRCDLFEGLEGFMSGVETVFHVAGVNEMCSPDPQAMYRANIDGAVSVARAARAAGVRRLVITSSAATIGEERGEVGREETVHRGVYLSHYERSKHLGELAVLDAVPDLDVVVVNPSSVQGPGRATGTGRLILDLINGRLPFLVDTRVSIVDIDDCARGHILAAERGRAGRRYILNSFTIGMDEAVATLETITGKSLPVRYLPGWVAQLAVGPVEAGARLLRRRPRVCREMVRTMRHGHAYDGSRAQRELGLEYTPAATLMTRLVEWFRQEGLAG